MPIISALIRPPTLARWLAVPLASGAVAIGAASTVSCEGGDGDGEFDDLSELRSTIGVTELPAGAFIEGLEITEWHAGRIGQRGQLEAIAVTHIDGVLTEVTGLDLVWTSDAETVLQVTNASTGAVLARETGDANISVTVTNAPAGSVATATRLISADDTDVVPQPDGWMYTMWLARGGVAPLYLTGDGELEVHKWYDDKSTEMQLQRWRGIYCPTDVNYNLGGDLDCSILSDPQLSMCQGRSPDDFDPPELFSPWTLGAVSKFQSEGGRIGLLTDVDEVTGLGTFRVLDRGREWTVLGLANVEDFVLEGDRIGIVQENGKIQVKDGIDGPWVQLASQGWDQLHLEGDRIGIVNPDGKILAKDGIFGTWAPLADSGYDLYLEGDVIGMVERDGGRVRVKLGLYGAVTELAANGYRTMVIESNGLDANGEYDESLEGTLAGTRFALIDNDDSYRVTVSQGPTGPWTNLVLSDGPGIQVHLDGDRIGVLFDDGRVWVKEGHVNTPWHYLSAAGGAQMLQLQEGFIGILTTDNYLRIKKGVDDPFAPSQSTAEQKVQGVTQLQLLADIPSRPWRTAMVFEGQNATNLIDYGERLVACTNDTNCYPEVGGGLIAPDYGWTCGEGVGNGSNSKLDSLERACQQHDGRHLFYDCWGYNPGIGGGCIMRWATDHARVTVDGVPSDISAVPQAVQDAFAAYENKTCTNNDFEQETKSRL